MKLKTAFKWFGIVVFSVFTSLIVIGLFLPAQVRVSRSLAIQAPPKAIYPLIADFKHGWEKWNAFDDGDPGIRYTYEGPDSGVGAAQVWTSKKMGDGRMTLVKADSLGVAFELAMGPKPFRIAGVLRMDPNGPATTLTWADEFDMGNNPFKRILGFVIGRMIGSSFEKSLANIKKLAEAGPTP